ncbi:MAG: glutathione S-transferase family protein [Chromatiales bacterium]|jgi:glutathione S-transferase|nr:glutathione S-transferase family protein [Chromatiales bacterium]
MMKLYGGASSPYVRKCRVAARELGIVERLEEAAMPTYGADPNTPLAAMNPAVRVPTLELDNGGYLYDSRIILRYLNETAGGSLYPASDWAMQRRESQAEGMIDAALLSRGEGTRPEEFRYQTFIDLQARKIDNALDALETQVDDLGRVDAAAIGTGCGLGYLDFRFADWGWRDNHPGLASWFETFNARPSMQATMPA